MIIPPKISKGDTVALIATAKMISEAEMNDAIKLLQNWGLRIEKGQYLFHRQGYFAGTDEQRIADLQAAIDNPDIKAIFCARGGYGTTRMIDHIDFAGLKRHPRWVVGFSDLTALLIHLEKIGIASLHAPMPFQYGLTKYHDSVHQLKKVLFHEPASITWTATKMNRLGDAEGIVIGGNLSILTHLIGSASDVGYDGKILFLEEVEEYLYKIDRMMIQLKRAGKLKNLSALVVGHMTDMMDNDTPYGKTAYQIIDEVVAEYDYPVFYGAPIGHEAPNSPVPVGLNSKIFVQDNHCIWKFRVESEIARSS